MPAEGPRLRNLLCRIGPQTPWWAPFFIDIRASERRVSTNKRLGRRYNPTEHLSPVGPPPCFPQPGKLVRALRGLPTNTKDIVFPAPCPFFCHRLMGVTGHQNAHASTVPDPFLNRIVLTTERVSMRLLAIADTNMRNSSHVAMRLFRLVVAH